MRTAALAAAFLVAGCASGAAGRLDARLAANPSATATLDAICNERRVAPRVVARLSSEPPVPAPAEARAALGDEPLRHRRVHLVCGDGVLSVADNWYRPSQLSAEMNQALEATDTPFGRTVAALNFTRRRLASTRTRGPYVLEHRAVLVSAAGQPFSYVIERYTSAALR